MFKFKGIILNYNETIKNKLISLLAINYKSENNKYNNILKFNTKCSLILSDKNNIKIWENIFKTYFTDYKFYIVKTKRNFKNIFNKDIFTLDFLIIDINIISNKFYKNYFKKYYSTNNLDISIINSINDNLYNKNINNEIFNNLYIFNWNNIIYDNISKITILDKNKFIFYLSTSHVKYYLSDIFLENNILDYIIKNSIDNVDNFDLDNFYYFMNKELTIKDSYKNNKIKYEFIELTLSENEQSIYDKLFCNEEDNEDNILRKSLFFLEYDKYNFKYKVLHKIYKSIEDYYELLIEKDNNKIFFLKNLYKKKELYTENNLYKNIYYFDIILEKSEDDINLMINDILNIINSNKTKLQYCKNMISTFYDINHNCSICIDNIDNKNICIINCGHYFCKDCLIKFINKCDNKHECPICRDKFNIDEINIAIKDGYDTQNLINCTKINKLIEIINIVSHTKIIIITQFKEVVNKIIEKFNIKENKKHISVCDYNNILKHNIYNIDCIVFLDYLYDIDEENNIYSIINNKLGNNFVKFYFMYIKNTFEKNIIDKYI